MNPFKLENNYFIQGFERYSEVFDKVLQLGGEQNVLYKGKVSDINEETAILCVEHNIERCKYKNYNPDTFKPDGIKVQGFNWAVFSIHSIFEPQYKYCIIYESTNEPKFKKIFDNQYIKDKVEFEHNNEIKRGIIIIGERPVITESNPIFINDINTKFIESVNNLHKEVNKHKSGNNKAFSNKRENKKSNMFESRSECGKGKIRKMR